MRNLEYSVDALNAKSAFYRAKTMVYVEGEDDVLFWQEVLSRTTDAQLEIEPVGGSGEIDKYIAQLESGELQAIVARDSDLLPLVGNASLCPRILYTFGYSIENTLYTVDTIHQLAKSWCKSNKVTVNECQAWLDELAKIFAPLLRLDIANTLSDAGLQTVGDNCTRFMTSQSSAVPCSTRVSTFTTATRPHLPLKSMTAAEAAVGTNLSRIILFLRGHFLASAVIKFLVNKARSYSKKVTISSDSLYAAALIHFGAVFGPAHPHFDHYATSAASAVRHL
ncbi:DUF4435 domain-containing protein [Sulfuriferula sp. GW1]|uniref:DUF4435 domain-containing protein n=1 Tax=Sulfuriferula sp. GW1 TaxID=3345111 RepID=UPI0039AEB229